MRGIALGVFFSVCLIIPQTGAGETYRWTDPAGNVVIGSKPPKNARNVTPFKTKPLSRYSTTRMLKRLPSTRASLSEPPAKTSSSESATDDSFVVAATLTASAIEVVSDEQGTTEEIRITIENNGTVTASGVRVQVKLEDGKVYQTLGPVELPAGTSESYRMEAKGLVVEEEPQVIIDYY